MIVVRSKNENWEICNAYQKALQKSLGEDYLVIVSPFNVYSPDGSAPMLSINEKDYSYSTVINKLKEINSNVAYMDYEILDNQKLRLILYKNNMQYIVDNTKCNWNITDLVKILSQFLDENDIVYVDIHGFGISLYDNLKAMKIKVERIGLYNVNRKLYIK